MNTKPSKISKSEGFGLLLKTKPIHKTHRLMLHAIHTNESLTFGVMIPKRFAKRAVDRNVLKRLIREACRQQKIFTQGKILVRLVKPIKPIVSSDRADWWKEIHRLFSV